MAMQMYRGWVRVSVYKADNMGRRTLVKSFVIDHSKQDSRLRTRNIVHNALCNGHEIVTHPLQPPFIKNHEHPEV